MRQQAPHRKDGSVARRSVRHLRASRATICLDTHADGVAEVFKALVLEQVDGAVTSAVRDLDDAALPAGDVTVAVEYTTVNYKDGIVITSGGGLVKRWPHVPGIDFSGTVLTSQHPAYRPGARVVLTGWRVGEIQWGGCAQKAAVSGEHLIPLPEFLSTRQAMAIGTAGFTAMLAVMALESAGL